MIRPIEKGDLVVIREINAQSLGYDCSLEQTERQFFRCTSTLGHILLAYIDDISGAVQGYIHAQVYESLYSDTGLNILGLAVLPSHQGQGIGASLLKAVSKPIFSTKRMAITPIKCRSVLSSTFSPIQRSTAHDF